MNENHALVVRCLVMRIRASFESSTPKSSERQHAGASRLPPAGLHAPERGHLSGERGLERGQLLRAAARLQAGALRRATLVVQLPHLVGVRVRVKVGAGAGAGAWGFWLRQLRHRLQRCAVCSQLALLPSLRRGRCSVGRARHRAHGDLVQEAAAAARVARVGGAGPSDGRPHRFRCSREPVQSPGRRPLHIARSRDMERAEAAAVRRREVGPLTVKELLCALRNLCRALNGRGRLEAAGPRTERTRLEAGFGYPGGVASRPFVMVRCARFVVALHFNLGRRCAGEGKKVLVVNPRDTKFSVFV